MYILLKLILKLLKYTKHNLTFNFFHRLFLKIIVKKRIKIKVDILSNKYKFLENNPYNKLSFKDKERFLRLGIQDRDISVLKYSRYEHNLARNLKEFFFIQSIFDYNTLLDIGCGAGYFVSINKFFKKEAIGLDWFNANGYYNDKSILFLREMNELLNVKPIDYKVTEYFKPKIKKKFDLITAFSANFDGEYINRFKYVPWSAEKYEIFFRNLTSYLNPNGKFFIRFNEKWEYEHNYYIDNEYKNYLKTKNFWHERGIVSNIKIDKDLNHFLNSFV